MRSRALMRKWYPLLGTTIWLASKSLLKTISPDRGHFTHTPLGMSFFLATLVGYWGLLKCAMGRVNRDRR